MYSARRGPRVLATFIWEESWSVPPKGFSSEGEGDTVMAEGVKDKGFIHQGKGRRRAFQDDAESTVRWKARREVFQWVWHTYSPTPTTINTHTHSQSAQEHKTGARVKPRGSDWDLNPMARSQTQPNP